MVTGMLLLMSFSSENIQTPPEAPFNCTDYAIDAMNAQQEAFGPWSDSVSLIQDFWDYMNDCVQSEGNIAPPVFIK